MACSEWRSLPSTQFPLQVVARSSNGRSVSGGEVGQAGRVKLCVVSHTLILSTLGLETTFLLPLPGCVSQPRVALGLHPKLAQHGRQGQREDRASGHSPSATGRDSETGGSVSESGSREIQSHGKGPRKNKGLPRSGVKKPHETVGRPSSDGNIRGGRGVEGSANAEDRAANEASSRRLSEQSSLDFRFWSEAEKPSPVNGRSSCPLQVPGARTLGQHRVQVMPAGPSAAAVRASPVFPGHRSAPQRCWLETLLLT